MQQRFNRRVSVLLKTHHHSKERLIRSHKVKHELKELTLMTIKPVIEGLTT